MQFYNDKKICQFEAVSDIYVSFGFAALIITDRKLYYRRSTVFSNKLTFKGTDVWNF
jgi:hypothetical protein